MSRTHNTMRNFASGLIKQILEILLPFIIRTIVIYYLGVEFQGLSGLFSSILQMLSLAELGFTSAVVFALYKPIAEKDTTLICALINYLKKVYRIVGFVMLGIGLIILPFLRFFISGHVPEDVNIYVLYVIYLFNSVISYELFAYKSALLTAMQRGDIVNNIQSLSTLSIRIIQIILLVVLRNYYIFILVMPIGTVANNLLLQYWSKKIIPEAIPYGNIPKETKESLNKQIRALLICKIADTARNSFDNIIISSFIGLSAVTIYGNYLYIYSGIRGFFLVLTNAMQASVGNSIVEESVEKNYRDLNKFTLYFMILAGWCTTCLFCLYQPFIMIWMSGNSSMLLSFLGMSLFCLYFYLINMNNTMNLYFHGNGFYWQCRWWYIIEAGGNLGLNIILGYYWGINGVLIATIFTIFAFNFLPKVSIVFGNYFKRGKESFLLKHVGYFIVMVAISLITMIITSHLTVNGILEFIIKAILVALIAGVLYLLIFIRNPHIKFLIKTLKSRLSK